MNRSQGSQAPIRALPTRPPQHGRSPRESPEDHRAWPPPLTGGDAEAQTRPRSPSESRPELRVRGSGARSGSPGPAADGRCTSAQVPGASRGLASRRRSGRRPPGEGAEGLRGSPASPRASALSPDSSSFLSNFFSMATSLREPSGSRGRTRRPAAAVPHWLLPAGHVARRCAQAHPALGARASGPRRRARRAPRPGCGRRGLGRRAARALPAGPSSPPRGARRESGRALRRRGRSRALPGAPRSGQRPRRARRPRPPPAAPAPACAARWRRPTPVTRSPAPAVSAPGGRLPARTPGAPGAQCRGRGSPAGP